MDPEQKLIADWVFNSLKQSLSRTPKAQLKLPDTPEAYWQSITAEEKLKYEELFNWHRLWFRTNAP